MSHEETHVVASTDTSSDDELIVEVKRLVNHYKAYAAGLVPPLTALIGVVVNWGNTGVWNWNETRIILASMVVGLITGVITWLTKAGTAVGEITEL